MTAQPQQAQTRTGVEVPDGKDPIERTVDNVNGQNIMGDFRPPICLTPRARWPAGR